MSPSAPDPYLPGHGTAAYRVTRYELELDYKVSSNRLSGRAVLHAVAQLPTSAVVMDLAGLRATKIQLSGRKVRKFSPRANSSSWFLRPPCCRARRSLSISATRATRPRAGACGVKWAGRNSPTAPWSRGSPTAPPPGFRATTTRGTRPATGSRSPLTPTTGPCATALRLHCGDLAFFALLQSWTESFSHASVSTPEFIRTADRVTGLDTEALLHPWLYEEALPPLPLS
jgi:aminopeptidase N